MRRLSLIAILICASALDAKPEPKTKPSPPKAKEPAPLVLPNLEEMLGATNWGVMAGSGKDFTLSDHPQWSAVVQVRQRRDGSVWIWVLWSQTSNGEACPGVYRIENGELSGIWGYGNRVQVDGDGQMTGTFSSDRIRRMPEPGAVP